MASSRAPSKRAAAKAAAAHITASKGGRVQVGLGPKTPIKKTPTQKTSSTKAKTKVVDKTAVNKTAKKEPKTQTKTVKTNSSRRRTPTGEELEQSKKDFQKGMGLVMWRFQREQKLLDSGSKYGQWLRDQQNEQYHAKKNPKGVERNEGFLLYRQPPAHSPDGCIHAVLEPVTKTWKYYFPPADPTYFGTRYGFPEGFSREHPNFIVEPVWRYYYQDPTVNMGSVVFRVEDKVSKKCRLIDVDEAEKTTKHDFNYPTDFVKAGAEGEFSHWQHSGPAPKNF
jgi:hypothetical protein